QREPKQARSRHTLHRLLAAAEALLEHGGLEAATVPAIADAAGVSVGVIYRRFPDKDALLRAVYERSFQMMAEEHRIRFQAAGAMEPSLQVVARQLIVSLVESYRRKPG